MTETSSDAGRAVRATARATRIGTADATVAQAALVATAIGRAEVRARIEVAAGEAALGAGHHRARIADATVLVGADVVGAAREGRDADRHEKEPEVLAVHHVPFHPFSRTRERRSFSEPW